MDFVHFVEAMTEIRLYSPSGLCGVVAQPNTYHISEKRSRLDNGCDVCGGENEELAYACRVHHGFHTEKGRDPWEELDCYAICYGCYENLFKIGRFHVWSISREDFEAARAKYYIQDIKEPGDE